MDLEQLRAFLAVVETGSFLTAARVLKMSRATLRRRIDELEARAGIPLLDRTRVGAVVTEPGRMLAERGRLLVQEAGAVLESVRELGAAPSGLLRVMLPVGLPPHLLAMLVSFLRERLPHLSFRVRFSDDPVGGLLDDVDIAVHFGLETPQGPWISYEFLRMRVWPIASADYLARRGTPRSLAELAGHDLLSWEQAGEDGRQWPLLNGGTVRVAPFMRTTDVHLLRQLAIAGLGVALVPDGQVPDPGLPAGSVVPVLGELIGREVALRIVIPTALSEIPKIRVFLELIRPMVGIEESKLGRPKGRDVS